MGRRSHQRVGRAGGDPPASRARRSASAPCRTTSAMPTRLRQELDLAPSESARSHGARAATVLGASAGVEGTPTRTASSPRPRSRFRAQRSVRATRRRATADRGGLVARPARLPPRPGRDRQDTRLERAGEPCADRGCASPASRRMRSCRTRRWCACCAPCAKRHPT